MKKEKKQKKVPLNQEEGQENQSQPEAPENPIPEEPRPSDNNELELLAKVESILFCIPEGVAVDILANKLNLGLKDDVRKILLQLKENYDAKSGGVKLMQEGDVWKFSIPDEHTDLIREAAIPEFDIAVLETLAYIAWRGGSRQCDVVRVRSNKAYNHIKLLKEKGFIESHKSGLSKWLSLTKKFYEYFKVNPGEKLKVPEEVEKRLEEAEKAAEEIAKKEEEEKQAREQALKQQEGTTSQAAQTAKEMEDEEEPSDDEPDSGYEPESEDEEQEEDNPDNE